MTYKEELSIPNFREQLAQFFLKAAERRGVTINPVIREAHDMEVWGLIYEEFSNDRSFRITPEEDGMRSIDIFFQKNYGFTGTELLSISVSSEIKNINIAWTMYEKWIIDGCPVGEIYDMYNNLVP